jgi:hypothetical protein
VFPTELLGRLLREQEASVPVPSLQRRAAVVELAQISLAQIQGLSEACVILPVAPVVRAQAQLSWAHSRRLQPAARVLRRLPVDSSV